MLNPKEYSHLIKCLKDTSKLPQNSTKRADKIYFLRERISSSWKIGEIDVKQYFHLKKVLEKIEKCEVSSS